MNTDKIYAESIAKEYAPKETSKVVALRKLDNKAKRPANIFAYTFGIISAFTTHSGDKNFNCNIHSTVDQVPHRP